MGVYVNPPSGEDKVKWLKREGKKIDLAWAEKHDDYENVFLVVVLDNFLFTAAGICFCESEKQAFLEVADGRRKEYYLVAKTMLCGVSRLAEYLEVPS